MSDIKSNLQRVFGELKGLEERARGLKNQNLADIAASAHGRVKQLVDHPDLELVDERKDQTPEGDPNVHATAPGGVPFPQTQPRTDQRFGD